MNIRPLTLIIFGLLHGAMADAQGTFFTRLCSSTPDKVVVSCMWDSLLLPGDQSSWDALITIVRGDTTETWKAELTVRGKYRRTKCAFPPLEINLKKGALRKHGLLEYDKLKLVTHCNTEKSDPSDLYEEELIYHLYRALTPYSFDVLEIPIDYEYPDGKVYLKNTVALLLEPTAELAHRLGGQELEQYSVAADSLDASSYCRNALFQFMVGNFDWNLTVQQNLKMIGQPGNYHLVPYDFDFSAIVSPAYARMPTDFTVKDFRDRIYKGQYFTEELPAMMREFTGKKELILSQVNNFNQLSKSRRREIVTYLNQFFDFIGDPNCQIAYGTLLPYSE
jgi:hypothetical protein